jgi:hypothetical protein
MGGSIQQISVGLKVLCIIEEKKFIIVQLINKLTIYDITTNTTCISKKKNNNKPTNQKIFIQKKNPTNQIQKTTKILLKNQTIAY